MISSGEAAAAEPSSRYGRDNLLPALRIFVRARRESLTAGSTDNGGAIHSVERLLDILCQRLCHPDLRHTNHLKKRAWAERSVGADLALREGRKVDIEHVAPMRALAKEACRLIEHNATEA